MVFCALAGALALTLAGCRETAPVPPSGNPAPMASPVPAETEPAAEFSFADLQRLQFCFTSGAGGWCTLLVRPDGSFYGEYHDTDMGGGEPGIHAVQWNCKFTGRFAQPVRVNDYTYSMGIAEISYEKEAGTEEVIDGIQYYYTAPYGLEDAEEILVYLPGAPLAELPQEFRGWVGYYDETEGELSFYALNNEAHQQGFESYDWVERVRTDVEWAEETAAEYETTILEDTSLSQGELNELSAQMFDLWDIRLNEVWAVLRQVLPQADMEALTAEELEAQNQRRTNQYVGVGITVNYTREEGLYILGVETGGPAEAAGLEAGEVITAVDGVSLAGESRYEGANLIQGEAGTTVTLEVLGEDGAARTVEVERAELETDPVESRMLEGKVGYVRLLNFYDHSAQRLEEAVTQLREQGAEALVFDMRNNGGGYLSQLTDMLDFLLPEGPIFISRDRAGHEEITNSDADCVELPMAVLVNADTYSAAEFFAAELQEQGAAVIVGEPTSGKGYSQQTFPLPHGGAVAISTGAYFTGSGASLIGTGLTLDAEVYNTGAEDTQLAAALELLKIR